MTDTLARQRQLIGTTAMWAANDLIIGDGEYALERTTTGRIRVKIGNGVLTYSALPYGFDVGGAFGEGYTWRVAASLTSGAERTAPDHPIQVAVHAQFATGAGHAAIYVDGLLIANAANGGNGEMHQSIGAIVPPDTEYVISWDALTAINVHELRAD